MRLNKKSIIFSFLISALFIGLVNATSENSEKAGKPCTFCHPEGPPALGDAGLYFQEHRTIEGFGEIGVHLSQWDVAMICFSLILLTVLVVHLSRI